MVILNIKIGGKKGVEGTVLLGWDNAKLLDILNLNAIIYRVEFIKVIASEYRCNKCNYNCKIQKKKN